ncbi:MAG: DUF3261 domain-containing protein [Candidatus Paracaedibacteraceae bacterium]|nr:DUF3261 domain-containing protein [Candidatus Paracaedibacteraceae bacterium]
MTNVVLIVCLSLFLSGCSQTSSDSLVDLSQTKTTTQTIQLSKGVYLNVDQIWPLTSTSGAFLQRVKATVAEQENIVTVHIDQTPDQLSFVAFNDLIGRLYALTWTQNKTSWEASDHIPATMIPENIIGDFLLVHLSQDTLNQNLVGAHVVDRGADRLLEANDHTILRKITRRMFSDGIWQQVTLDNPPLNYRLEIETVVAP